MKGIILAGGIGSRLYPLTQSISKQLLPVYDKPMIYYAISVLFLAQIKDILIISTPKDIKNYENLLGNGNKFGVKFSYIVQEKPEGLAQAFILGEKFINKEPVTLVLGDNIFFSKNLQNILIKNIKNIYKNGGARIFCKKTDNPKDFGVIEFDKTGNILSIEEKPKNPKSNYIMTGLYMYDSNVCEYAKQISPSSRKELEITDLNRIYLNHGTLHSITLNATWFDTGTPDLLIKASSMVKNYQKKYNKQIACLEEISLENQFITKEKLLKNLPNINNEYYQYIRNL
jgi:glucose-1-phosphate thymidylyltransferase